METQLRIVSKQEAHQIIESIPGDCVMVLTFNECVGISDNGKIVKKKRGEKMVDRAKVLVLAQNSPIVTLNLHDTFFNELSNRKREKGVVRTILIPQLE